MSRQQEEKNQRKGFFISRCQYYYALSLTYGS